MGLCRLWPLELSRHLPSTAQIFGYDISPAQFPAKEWLPHNVQLDILDVVNQELPKELKNAFDVVHLRAFALVIKGGDPKGVLNTLVEMLSMLTPLQRFVFCSSALCYRVSFLFIIFFVCLGFFKDPRDACVVLVLPLHLMRLTATCVLQSLAAICSGTKWTLEPIKRILQTQQSAK